MPSYQTTQIAILFQLMLAKVGKSPSFKDFKAVSAAIGNDVDAADVDISPGYLSEQHNKMLDALKLGQSELKLSQKHVDACCHYLGYASHQEFQRHYDNIMAYLEPEEVQSQKLQLHYYRADHGYIQEKLLNSFYPGQEKHVNEQVYDELNELLRSWTGKKVLDSFTVWCLPLDAINPELVQEIQSFLKANLTIKNLIPVLPEKDDGVEFNMGNPLYEEEVFQLVITLCHQLAQNTDTGEAREKSGKGSGVNIYGSGPVVVGNVKAKNYINGDMHITKNKHK